MTAWMSDELTKIGQAEELQLDLFACGHRVPGRRHQAARVTAPAPATGRSLNGP